MGYRHAGTEVYLNRRGRISNVTGVLKMRDRWWGFVRTLRKWRIDHFSDHLMGEYINAIRHAVEQEHAGMRPRALEKVLGHVGCPSVAAQEPPAPHIAVAREPADKPTVVRLEEASGGAE